MTHLDPKTPLHIDYREHKSLGTVSGDPMIYDKISGLELMINGENTGWFASWEPDDQVYMVTVETFEVFAKNQDTAAALLFHFYVGANGLASIVP